MTRLVATLAAAGGVAAFLFYLHVLGKGPFASLEARHLREMKDRTATPQVIEPMTHLAFFTLPRGLAVAEYSGIERRAVSLEGRVMNMLRATDGDYHVELYPPADAPPGTGARSVTTEITPQWHGDAARGWGYERLAALFRTGLGSGAAWEQGPARVRLSGWLLYDQGDAEMNRLLGRRVHERVTDWEIHPVTKIEHWDETVAAWVEVRR